MPAFNDTGTTDGLDHSTRTAGGSKSLQLCFACYLGHAATLPLTVLFLPTAKLPSKLFRSKFRTWLLHPVVSRQNLKFITGYTLQALR